MRSLHRAIVFSAIERYGSVAIFVVSAAILSRLLSPTEFGIYAVANVFISIVGASFQEIGGSNYIIQKRSLSERDVRTCFTIILGLSLTVCLVIIAFRAGIGRLLGNDALKYAVTVAALTFVVSPVSATLSALLRRDMNFKTLAICGLCGSAVAAASSITLAFLGFSYMAPIWGVLLGKAVTAALLVAMYRKFRIFGPSLSGYPDILRFGLYSSSISIINVLCTLAPQIVIARILDFGAVGLYNRSVNTTQIFDKVIVQSLNPVIMPAIVERADGEGNLKRVYLEALKMLSAAQWPFLISIAVMAPPVIDIWLGKTWIDTVPLIRLLSAAYVAMFGACMTYPVLVAVGRVHDALMASLISLPPSMVVTLASAFFGVKMLAASALLTLPFQAGVSTYFVCRSLGIGLGEVAGALRQSVIVTACATVGVFASEFLIERHYVAPLPGLILAAIVALAGWVIGLRLTRHLLLVRLLSAADGLPFRVPKALFQSS